MVQLSFVVIKGGLIYPVTLLHYNKRVFILMFQMTDAQQTAHFGAVFSVLCAVAVGGLAHRREPALRKRGVHQTPHALCDTCCAARSVAFMA